MKDHEDTSFVLGISILRDFSQGIIQISQKSYINKLENEFDIISNGWPLSLRETFHSQILLIKKKLWIQKIKYFNMLWL